MIENFDLIIYDCDGTLVDSEILNNKAFTDLLQEYGLEKYTLDYSMQHFVGKTVSNIMLMIQMETGFDFPEDTVPRYIANVERMQKEELCLIPGALELVQQTAQTHKICVASNGERSNVLRAVKLTGLAPYFPESHVFTKIQVKNPKPAPDLFLYAASQMDVAPERCLVIEDSASGVMAGAAAGMSVIGFTGSSHDKDKAAQNLTEAGAHHIIDNLIHISDSLVH